MNEKLLNLKNKIFTKENRLFFTWIITLIIYINFFNITIVSGLSMFPTFHNKDVLLMEKISVKFNTLNREDIISFREERAGEEVFFIKRIIGLPGETVEIKNGRVYINDILLDEEFLDDKVQTELPNNKESLKIKLKEDEYFVLGDNRYNSMDSRFDEVGPVKKDDIASKKLIRLFRFE